ncbi:ABC transporter permease [Paenibacillus sp. 7523-1]|uniref:ABC transporter permease n=1 Tax=Paenibacillus sp. 7523-1 TaxID=2022550 RepID=UPI000BA66AAF|nr:ABC transporter permease subunit [Paenibacillus sp. 7523-1]PAD33543.1 sugar ABC transporter permease [Paenibacillus sp. 7523-1]
MRRSTFEYRIQNIKRHWLLLVMILPGIIYLFINNYLPMLGIIIAFKNVNFAKGIWGSDWVGLDNFAYLFQTQDAWVITRNTLLYNGAFIVLGTILSIAVAVLLNEVRKRFVSRLYQSIILLPYLISMVIVAYLVLALLNEENGFVNHYVLPWLGIDSVSWYADAGKWPYILSIVYLWKNVGYTCIVYLASIVGISQEYYESATLDGASRWRQVWSITLPLIKPTMVILVLLSVGRIFNSDFGLFYQVPLNSGALQTTTDVIDTYVYRGLMTFGDFGMSSAAGLYQSIVGFVLVLTTNAFVRRKDKDLALF